MASRKQGQSCVRQARHRLRHHAHGLTAQGQPNFKRLDGSLTQGHGSALAALALHHKLGSLQINPASAFFGSFCAGHHIQTSQLGHPQATAIQQLHHGRIARFKPWVVCFLGVLGQLHRFVNTQCFGQWFGYFRRTHTLDGIVRNEAFARQPMVEAAPARQNEGNAASGATTAVHLSHPSAHMHSLHLRQIDIGSVCQLGEFLQV